MFSVTFPPCFLDKVTALPWSPGSGRCQQMRRHWKAFKTRRVIRTLSAGSAAEAAVNLGAATSGGCLGSLGVGGERRSHSEPWSPPEAAPLRGQHS